MDISGTVVRIVGYIQLTFNSAPPTECFPMGIWNHKHKPSCRPLIEFHTPYILRKCKIIVVRRVLSDQ